MRAARPYLSVMDREPRESGPPHRSAKLRTIRSRTDQLAVDRPARQAANRLHPTSEHFKSQWRRTDSTGTHLGRRDMTKTAAVQPNNQQVRHRAPAQGQRSMVTCAIDARCDLRLLRHHPEAGSILIPVPQGDRERREGDVSNDRSSHRHCERTTGPGSVAVTVRNVGLRSTRACRGVWLRCETSIT